MSTVHMTIDEMAESMTGFEEIAVEKHFGVDINSLLEGSPTKAVRALVFTDLARGERNAAEAKQTVMEMTLKSAMDYFADDDGDDIDPDEPDSESGKGAASSE